MDLYERFKTAANEIQQENLVISNRAFVLSNKIQPLLRLNSDKIVPYSSLSGLEDLGFIGGGFYSDSADKGVIMVTPSLFKEDSRVDVRLRATGVRILQILGITEVFAFGIGESLQKNDNGELIFWAEDHINLSAVNPLVGANIDEFGVRFPDMSAAYDDDLTLIGKRESEKAGFKVENGIWAAFDSERNRLDEFSEELIKNSVQYFCDELISESIAAAHGKLKLSLSLLVNPSEDAAEKLIKLLRQLIPESN